RQPSDHPARGRADRQPGLEDRRGDSATAERAERARANHYRRDARPAHCGLRPENRSPARRQDCIGCAVPAIRARNTGEVAMRRLLTLPILLAALLLIMPAPALAQEGGAAPAFRIDGWSTDPATLRR